METLYRKVAFEIKHEDHEQTILVGKHATFKFNPNTISGEELEDFLSGCEEISDNTTVIEKLEAEKKELLEALEELKYLKWIKHSLGKNLYYLENQPKAWEKVESLIQKHKQCQENTPR